MGQPRLRKTKAQLPVAARSFEIGEIQLYSARNLTAEPHPDLTVGASLRDSNSIRRIGPKDRLPGFSEL